MEAQRRLKSDYKNSIKILSYSFLLMLGLSLAFIMGNFFICTSLGYFALFCSFFITELVLVWPELKKKEKNRKKIMNILGIGLAGAVLCVVFVFTGVEMYLKSKGYA